MANNTTDDTLLVSIPEAGRLLGISRTTVYSLIEQGQLTVKKIGKAARIRRADLARFVDELS